MEQSKRNFLKTVVLSCLLPAGNKLYAKEMEDNLEMPVRVMINRDYQPPVGNDYQNKLRSAVLNYLQQKFSGINLPLWNRKLSEIDIEKRIHYIIYWTFLAIERSKSIYPIDPAWIIAQIMSESYFYEFAMSPDLAVGICQFIPNTAKSYTMIYAGSLPAHSQPPFKRPELAGKVHEFHTIRLEKRRYIKNNKPDLLTLEETLDIIRQGEVNDLQVIQSKQQLDYMNHLKEFDEKINRCRDQYLEYLQANIQRDGVEKDIFTETDFFLQFDERFTYKKPIFAMADMLAKGLRSRNGNILAAAAGFNAGIGSTYFGDPVYRAYGRIPALEETTAYLSRTLANHYEIVKRI